MNTQKKIKLNNTASGNAMIYVLIALALFGALTLTLANQANQADGQSIDDDLAELYANELLGYTGSVQQAVDMMISTGSKVNDLDFVLPSDAAFNTAPHIHKVFHPQGGGMNYQEKFNKEIAGDTNPVPYGWYIAQFNNIEWTKTSAHDALQTAYKINKKVCQKINKKITGLEDIPALTVDMNEILLDTANNSDFTIAKCPECEGYTNLCVSNSGITAFSFYSIIAAQ